MIWCITICAKGIWDGRKYEHIAKKLLRPERGNATHNENLGRFQFQPVATSAEVAETLLTFTRNVSHHMNFSPVIELTLNSESLLNVLTCLEIFLSGSHRSGCTSEPVSESSLTVVKPFFLAQIHSLVLLVLSAKPLLVTSFATSAACYSTSTPCSTDHVSFAYLVARRYGARALIF